ncbi:MAG: hypothetical protein ACFFDN_35830 [Candidatus Hodarchaeota archaeon]
MNKKEVDLFKKVNTQINTLYTEISALSKKKPNDAINKFKLKYINKVLEDANKLLKQNYKPFTDFDLFDENDIPSNSDVTMMLSQYIDFLGKLRDDNIKYKNGEYFWVINGKISSIKTGYRRLY